MEIYRHTETETPELIGNTLFRTTHTEIWKKGTHGITVRKYRNNVVVQSYLAAVTDPTLIERAAERGIELN